MIKQIVVLTKLLQRMLQLYKQYNNVVTTQTPLKAAPLKSLMRIN